MSLGLRLESIGQDHFNPAIRHILIEAEEVAKLIFKAAIEFAVYDGSNLVLLDIIPAYFTKISIDLPAGFKQGVEAIFCLPSKVNISSAFCVGANLILEVDIGKVRKRSGIFCRQCRKFYFVRLIFNKRKFVIGLHG